MSIPNLNDFTLFDVSIILETICWSVRPAQPKAPKDIAMMDITASDNKITFSFSSSAM